MTDSQCKWRLIMALVVMLWASVAWTQTAIQYVYDELGRLIAVVDPNGDTATYHYDAVGNILSIERHSSSQVSIISFIPTSGPVGTTVTIAGTGFSSTASQNAVTFNGTAATVSSATTTQLVVTAPTGATTGTIAVIAPGGSATSASAFTVATPNTPTITGFTPAIGTSGATVSVTGTNFETTLSNDSTWLNVTRAAVSAATTTSLTTAVPLAAGSGPITIATPSGTAVSATDLFVPPPPFTAADVEFTSRIAMGGSQVVTLNTANRIGLVTFAGNAGQRISLKGTNGMSGQVVGCDVNVSIRNHKNDVLAGVTCMEGSGFIDVLTLPASATYTGVVDPLSTATGSLTLTLYNVPPDVSGSITPGGSAVTVSITTPGQNGALTFTGTAGQKISLRGTNGTISGQIAGCDVNVSIVNPDSSVLAAATCMEGSGFIDAKTLPATGTYTIPIDPVSTATGNLTLTLYTFSDVSGTITPGGASATVTISNPGQNGALTFSGTAGNRISLQGTNGTISGQIIGCDVNVSILNPDSSVLAAATCMEGSGFIDVKTLPTTGTYTIVVDPVSTATGSLTLTLYSVPADPSATLTIGGGAATLTTTTPGQNALATFSGTSGQQVTVHLTSNTMGSTTVKLLKPDGSQLTSTTSSASSFNLATQTLPTTGTYTISIDPATTNVGSITVSVTNP